MKKVSRPKKKIGRPALRPVERRSVQRTLGFRIQEVQLLDAAATVAGKPFRIWAREVLLAAVDGE